MLHRDRALDSDMDVKKVQRKEIVQYLMFLVDQQLHQSLKQWNLEGYVENGYFHFAVLQRCADI
jgi:hypothetical protein